MKIKYIFPIILSLFIISISCNNSSDNFDHEGQAVIDDLLVREYLETHFYTPPVVGENFGTIDTILNGETPIMSQVITQNVNFVDIDYKVYVLRNTPEGVGASPSRVDSVLVRYKGTLINPDQTKFDERTNYTWLLLTNTIPGWSYGFVNFKEGVNVSVPDMPIEYDNTGDGVLFMPSGLAYRDIGSGVIGQNQPIMFHIKLGQVEQADHDFDGISSIYEDLNSNNDFTDDDTDADQRINYLDADDDGDGRLTIDENADPNGDGNPNDALDSDGDNTPDYLDSDS
jgi:hypothetical protein